MFSIGNVKVGARLGLGFGVVVVLLVGVSFLGITRLRALNERTQIIVTDLYPKSELAKSVVDDVNVIGQSMRNAVIFSEQAIIKKELDRIETANTYITGNLKKIEKMINSEMGRGLLKAVIDARGEFAVPQNEFVRLVGEGKKEEAKNLLINELRLAQLAYMDAVNSLIKIQGESMVQGGEEARINYRRATALMLSLAGLAVLLACGIAFWVTRTITQPLNQAVGVAQRVASGDLTGTVDVKTKDETGALLQALGDMVESLVGIVGEVRAGAEAIGTGTRQIASGNADLSQRTEEQASSLEETASSIEELTGTVKQNAENAKQANQLAIGASEVAVKGGEVVSQVVGTMASINESSKKIVDIISVIDGIAFQTNILALNAAVEAARAGEQGRGFAVVATEVRNLAQRSAAAAKEIKALIGDSVDKVGAGTKLVDEAGKTMEEIVASVKRVTDIMSEITAASQEQSAGIEQVNQAITQMDGVTQQNAALVEEAAAAAELLEEQARNLEAAVAVFNVGRAAESGPITHSAGALDLATVKPAKKSEPRNLTLVQTAKGKDPSAAPRVRVAGGGGEEQWEEF